MIEKNKAADLYIEKTGIEYQCEDYGCCYLGHKDIIFMRYPSTIHNSKKRTATQYWYQNLFTCLAFSLGHPTRLNKPIPKSDAKLAANHLCHKFGITKEDCTMSQGATEIINNLDRLQLK